MKIVIQAIRAFLMCKMKTGLNSMGVVMLADMTTLSLKGANFSEMTDLRLFQTEKEKRITAVLLYGRNGSGKSSIARAIRTIKGEYIPIIDIANFSDGTKNLITISDEERKQLFIFDEDFVNKNVRIQEDHLDTIVMLGEAVGLSEEISRVENEKENAEQTLRQREEEYNKFNDEKNTDSPIYILKCIEARLKGDGNWAGRKRKITGHRLNSAVGRDTYKQFISRNPTKDEGTLLLDLQNKLDELEQARKGDKLIKDKVPVFSLPDNFNKHNLLALLQKKIEKPILTEREKRIFALISSGQADKVRERLSLFKNPKTTECPYCFQSLNDGYKNSLIEDIESVLNDEVKTHQNALRKCFIDDQCNLNFSAFQQLANCSLCSSLAQEINKEIERINILIDHKIANPYQPIKEKIQLDDLIVKLSLNLFVLEKQREEFNSTATQTAPIVSQLNEINDDLAALEIKELVKRLNQQQSKFENTKREYGKVKSKYEEIEAKLSDLEAKKKNVRIAVDAINNCLAYIFFADDRLRIEYAEGVYKLKSRGRSVRPCDISVGERNIIGLCYFFTSIMNGKEEKNAYRDEYFLVIDDPISSYDHENKIGMMSFLKFKLNQFSLGNSNTRFLLMTHDLTTFYELTKVYKELFNKQANFYELRECALRPFDTEKRHEYTELLKIIYNYADGQTIGDEIVVGNMMRQVLEAFSTFEYRLGIEKISTNEDVLDKLEKPELKVYFKNLMYRLVLNGGSHRKDQVQAMESLDFFSLISEAEKRRTARDVLCFIYKLNPTHLIKHMKSSNETLGFENKLDSWCEDIERRAPIL